MIARIMDLPIGERPNIILFGVGHSGTTVVAKMLGTLGWNLPDADGFGENVQIRKCNAQILHKRPPDLGALADLVRTLPLPWVVKDPRFVLTLPTWIGLFQTWKQHERPVLLFLTRDLEKIERSYVANNEVKNGVPGMYGHTVRQLAALAAQGYEQWPYRKLQVRFEQVIEATALFNISRATRRDRVGN
jgi:hypothetical protein